MSSEIIDNLSKIISKLPGMGPRIAKRIILNLASNKEKTLNPLIHSLTELRDKVMECKDCGNIDENEICSICSNEKRNKEIVCIVETVADIWAVERTNSYNGLFFVTKGSLSSVAGRDPASLALQKLLEIINKNGVKEVIIATSANIDGQTTAYFISDYLKDLNLKITRLAYGVPVGGELEYLDEGTINIALKSRTDFE